jgi:hypothetical protein
MDVYIGEDFMSYSKEAINMSKSQIMRRHIYDIQK